MRTVFTSILIIMAGLLAIGCGDSQRLVDELAATNNRAAELDSMLTETQSQLTAASERAQEFKSLLAEARDERDALTSELATAKSRVTALKSELRRANTAHQKMADSLKAVAESVTMDLRTCQTELASAESRIVASERRINSLIRTRDSLYVFVDEVKPWYDYYRHEARRNWLKKLLGAGDAQKPETPEPVFGTEPPPTELEAARP
ncbi:MAG: hypothetical protein Kow0074_14550 [Candidatus Zixiibacteriota bacterium]